MAECRKGADGAIRPGSPCGRPGDAEDRTFGHRPLRRFLGAESSSLEASVETISGIRGLRKQPAVSHSNRSRKRHNYVKVKACALSVLWTAAVAVSLASSLSQEGRDAAEAARATARAAASRDLATLLLDDGRGEAAATVPAETLPLLSIPDVDEESLKSPSPASPRPEQAVQDPGRLHNLGVDQSGLRRSLTSFRPLVPANSPDEWERESLLSLTGGRREVGGLGRIDGHRYYRLLRPMVTRKGCLQCHGDQGYAVGEVMGGLSISVPMAPFWAGIQGRMLAAAVRHVLLWSLGMAVIYMGAVSLTLSDHERSRAEEALRESEAKFRHIYDNAPVMMLSIDEEGCICDVNRKWLADTGYSREDVIGRKAHFLMRGEESGFGLSSITPRASQDGQVQTFKCKYVRKDETLIDVFLNCFVTTDPSGQRVTLSVVHDVTEHQRAEMERKTFARLGTRLAGATSIESILAVVREESRRLLKWDACHFSLQCRTRSGSSVLSFVHTENGGERAFSSDEWPETALGEALRPVFEGRAVLIERTPDDAPLDVNRFGNHAWPSASLIFVPVRSGSHVIGVMSAQSCTAGRYGEPEVQLLQRIADAVSPALERVYAEQALREQYDILTFLNKVAQVTTGSLSPEEMCDQILEVVRSSIPCDAFLVNFHDPKTGLVQSVRAYDTIDGKLRSVSAPALPFNPDSLVGRRVMRECKPLLIHRDGEVREEDQFTPFGDVRRRSASLLYAPMVVGNRVIGVISTQSYTPKAYKQGDVELLEAIARQTGPALEASILSEQLRQSEQRFRTVIETAPDSIFMKDSSLHYIMVNPAMEALFGVKETDLIGRTDADLFDRETAQRIETVDRKVLRGETASDQYTKTISGVERLLHVVKVPMRDKTGNVIGLCGIARDVTLRKQLEDQLRQAAKMEAVGQLAGGIAHDFNNLLQGVLGYASLIKLGVKQDSKTYQSADVIEKTAERACQLTQQLLGFARRGKIQNIAVDLHETILEVIRLLGRTINKNITLVQNLRAKAAYVLGDPSQMQQVVLNLAINARDAMPDGGKITFESDVVYLDDDYCRNHTGSAPGEYVLISVSDTGRGIPKQLHDRIFEPFFTTKEPGTGTGMGLAMVYGIVKNHGGSIRVYSELGHGAVFKVYVPLAAGFSTPRSYTASVAPIRGTGHILVIDDEEVVRNTVSTMLRRLGYHVTAAVDGEEGVAAYRKLHRQIDLVVIDMIMPKMGGLEAFRTLREINPNLRAILSTGYSLDDEAQKILNEGMVGFIQKPYRIGRLSEVVATAIRGVRQCSV